MGLCIFASSELRCPDTQNSPEVALDVVYNCIKESRRLEC